MRLRLVHTLSLSLLAFAGLAVLALGGLTAWNLRMGFGHYLSGRDVVHLERFVALLESRAEREGGLSALEHDRLDMRALLAELAPPSLGLPGLGGPPAGPPGGRQHAGGPPGPGGVDGPPGPPGMPPPRSASPMPGPQLGAENFPDRVELRTLDGRLLLGRAQSPDGGPAGALIERPVRLGGEVVATARMRPVLRAAEGGERRFLMDQYRVIAASAAGLLVLALVMAALLARRWARPLAAVQQATERLARGELAVRVPTGPGLTGRSDEIGDVVRNVNRMAEGLERLEGARRRWLADISHELRTPLTVLRGDIEALQDGVRPLRPEAITVLHEEVLRLGKLVDDLHLLATSDLQALPCNFAPCDPQSLLQRLLRRFQPRADAAGLALSLAPAGSAESSAGPAMWDADRIEQLLANLLENSLRYTDAPGQIRLSLHAGAERDADTGAVPDTIADTVPDTLATTDAQASTLRILVDDSAPGVPPEQWSQLFEPLYRSDAARARQHGGSGLGLAIGEAIARAHGGRLWAGASPLGGLRITLSLPRHAPTTTATP